MSSELRRDNHEVAKDALKPDILKSDGERAGENIKGKADDLVSHVVGEPRDAVNPNAGDHATHDHGRKGVLDSAADAVRRADSETTGETISRKTEDAKSHLQPNETKGVAQTVTDTLTPGRQGGSQTGITAYVENAAGAVKDAVNNIVHHDTAPAAHKDEL